MVMWVAAPYIQSMEPSETVVSRVTAEFTSEQYALIAQAARESGVEPAQFVTEQALAAAKKTTADNDPRAKVLSTLQRSSAVWG